MTVINNIEQIGHVGVIGAGQMGIGIAQVLAQNGIKASVLDLSRNHVEKSIAKLSLSLGKLVERGKMEASAKEALLARIHAVDTASDFSSCDLVIEAATENFDLKVKLFQSVDSVLREGALLASNTSSISISKLAAATKRPALVGGIHFMNPVPLMKLCEIIRGVQTHPSTITLLTQLAHKLGKTTIQSNDAPGFLVNRILIPLLNEACFTLQEGVGTAEDIDLGAKFGLNHPMGPLELADLIGLDTVLSIAEVLHRELGDSKYRPATILRNLVAAGWLGKKSGRGFYEYDEKGQKKATAK